MSGARGGPQSPSSLSRILVLVSTGLIVLSVPLVIRLVDRLGYESTARTQAKIVAAQVKAKEQDLAKLRDAFDYARSDAFVEYWARVQTRLAKSGETIIIPADGSNTVRPITPWWQDFLR